MKVISIVPDRVDPMHVTDDEAWTNWDIKADVFNPNVYPFSADRIDLTLYFESFPNNPAAFCECNSINVGPRSNSTVQMKMRVPLYSAESGVPNLIGECMSRKIVSTKIFMKMLYTVSKSLKLIFETEFNEELECG